MFAASSRALMKACKLKLDDLKGALLDIDFAIHDGEDNLKAFFRQAKSALLGPPEVLKS